MKLIQNKKMLENQKNKKNKGGFYFLFVINLIYLVLAFFNLDKTIKAINSARDVFVSLILPLIFMILFLILIDLILDRKTIVKHLGKGSGIKGWFIAIFGGILSSGPIYVWYPLLKDLQKSGARNSLIFAFLYNRAIKLPILPVFIFYFGLKIVLIVSFTMILMSIIDGLILEKIVSNQ